MPVNLREILRVAMDQCHILLGVVRVHPCTEDLKDRPDKTCQGRLGNGTMTAGAAGSESSAEIMTELGRVPSGAFL